MKELKRKNFNCKKLIPVHQKSNKEALQRKISTIEYGKDYYQNVETNNIDGSDEAK